jgi:hypothetical protein
MLVEWANMDSDTVKSVILSNFQRSYKEAMNDWKKTEKLPEALRPPEENVNDLVIDFTEKLKLAE